MEQCELSERFRSCRCEEPYRQEKEEKENISKRAANCNCKAAIKCSEKNVRILKTSALYFACICLGLCLAVPGPTLLDLQEIVRTNVGKVAFIYLARSGSALIGSLAGGTLFEYVKKRQLLLVGFTLLMSVSALATPWSRSEKALVAIWAVGGLGSGALEAGLNVFCLNIWGNESPPYFQALHFMFGIGAFIAPLIAEPFTSKHCYLGAKNETLILTHLSDKIGSSESNITYVPCDNNSLPPVTYTYSIIGAISCLSTCFSLALALMFPNETKQIKEQNRQIPKPRKLMHGLVSTLAVVLLSLCCVIELGYAQLLVTFAVRGDLKLSKSTASFMTALFWGTFTLFRGFAVFLQTKFSAFSLLFVDLMAVLSSSTLLLFYGSKYVEVLWTGTFVLAIGLASFYPCVILWIEPHVHVDNKLAAIFVIAGVFGEMAGPLTIGQFVEANPLMLMYICEGCSISGCILAFIMWILLTKRCK